MKSTEEFLQEILANQTIIYAKLLKIQDKLKGTSAGDRLKDAEKELKKIREKGVK